MCLVWFYETRFPKYFQVVHELIVILRSLPPIGISGLCNYFSANFVWVCTCVCRCSQRPEEASRALGVGVTGSWKLPNVGAVNQTQFF